jgi:hypothetical protein
LLDKQKALNYADALKKAIKDLDGKWLDWHCCY